MNEYESAVKKIFDKKNISYLTNNEYNILKTEAEFLGNSCIIDIIASERLRFKGVHFKNVSSKYRDYYFEKYCIRKGKVLRFMPENISISLYRTLGIPCDCESDKNIRDENAKIYISPKLYKRFLIDDEYKEFSNAVKCQKNNAAVKKKLRKKHFKIKFIFSGY